MRIRYSEEPGEWRKFTWSSVAAPTLLAVAGAWRGRWPWLVPGVVGSLGLGVALLALLKPGMFRGWYRGGRWFGHQMGRIMGAVVLTLLFFLVLTPLALVLRLMGRSPLALKPEPEWGRTGRLPGPRVISNGCSECSCRRQEAGSVEFSVSRYRFPVLESGNW